MSSSSNKKKVGGGTTTYYDCVRDKCDVGFVWPIKGQVFAGLMICEDLNICYDKPTDLTDQQLESVKGKKVFIAGSYWSEKCMKKMIKYAHTLISLEGSYLKNFTKDKLWLKKTPYLSRKTYSIEDTYFYRGLCSCELLENYKDMFEMCQSIVKGKVGLPDEKSLIDQGRVIERYLERQAELACERSKELTFSRKNPYVICSTRARVLVTDESNVEKTAIHLSKMEDANYGVVIRYDLKSVRTRFTFCASDPKDKMKFIRVNSTYFPGGGNGYIKGFSHPGLIDLDGYFDLYTLIKEHVHQNQRSLGDHLND